MTYASLMVHVDNGVESDTRVTLAHDMAATFDARLIGIAATAPDTWAIAPYMHGALLGDALDMYMDLARNNLAQAATDFATLTKPRASRCEWRGEMDDPVEVITRQARAADLIILGRQPHTNAAWRIDVGDVLFAAGRPLLLTPPDPAPNPVGAPVLVAWKDTAETRRATLAALPLLKRADRVEVVEVCRDDDLEEAGARTADVADFLRLHGIAAGSQARPRGPVSAGDALLAAADDYGAGLIVAGAYGHARLRQRVLRGVTRTLLEKSPLCLLLSH